jgi:predicted NUDIX family phosphoesterase
MESEEQVLVIPANRAKVFTKNAGLSFFSMTKLDPILFAKTFLPRSVAESDPNYLQIIPYVVFFYRPPDGSGVNVFSYCRGAKGGEGRLHSKRSIGIGGHINESDTKPVYICPFDTGMQREIHEEVSVGEYNGKSVFGTIYDPSNEVGRVHLGVLGLMELHRPSIEPKDPSIVDSRLEPISKIVSEIDLYETWSQMVIEGLFKDIRKWML